MAKRKQDKQNRYDSKLLVIVIILSFIPFFTYSVFEVSRKLISSNEKYIKLAHYLGFTTAFLVVLILSIVFGHYIRAVNDKKILVNTLELRHITNSIHAGVVNFLIENKYKIIYASDGFYDIIGYSKEEVSDHSNSMLNYIYEEDLNAFKFPTYGVRVGDYVQKEFRIITKSNEVKWILFNGNYSEGKEGHTISAVMVDITESKQLHDRLIVEEQRYRVATEITNDVLFEYDIVKDIMHLPELYRGFFDIDNHIVDFSKQNELFNRTIHPEDIGLFEEFYDALIHGTALIEAEFRILDDKKEYAWCHIKGKTIYDEKMKPIKVIGKLVNINLYKKDYEILEYKAKRDPLTGVFNRNVTRELIENHIHRYKDQQHTFMIIDIDNFKNINDKYGHLVGDKVLSYVINQVKIIFSNGEIIGRIGGDEFIVFVGDTADKETIILKAEILHRTLQTIYRDGENVISLSGSIGISTYPKDGQTYEELLERADKAMYEVKEHGKDGFRMYA